MRGPQYAAQQWSPFRAGELVSNRGFTNPVAEPVGLGRGGIGLRSANVGRSREDELAHEVEVGSYARRRSSQGAPGFEALCPRAQTARCVSQRQANWVVSSRAGIRHWDCRGGVIVSAVASGQASSLRRRRPGRWLQPERGLRRWSVRQHLVRVRHGRRTVIPAGLRPAPASRSLRRRGRPSNPLQLIRV